MYDDDKKVIDLYGDGLPIEEIGGGTGLSTEEVLSILREYKESQFSRGKYSCALMRLVADRDSAEAKRKDIMSELKISRSFLVRAIKEYGFLSRAPEGSEEAFYMKVSDGFEFKECPECRSKRINKIQDGENEDSPHGIYCMSCGSEFTHQDNVVNIIKWEYVD